MRRSSHVRARSAGERLVGAVDATTAPVEEFVPAQRRCRKLLGILDEMGMLLVRRSYGRGEIVCREGEQVGALYVVREGVVRIVAEYAGHAAGKQATLRLVGPWEVFGHPVFAGSYRRSSTEAFTGCDVVKVPRVFLERAIRRRREVVPLLATLLEMAHIEQEELIGCLLPRKTEVRLARLLPILLGQFGESTPDGRPTVGLRLTRQDLGAMIAATRESVNYAIGELRERGVLEMERGRVVVLDPEALAKIAEG